MALIYCPECGTQVSEHAQQCIKCAYPINKINSNQNKQHSHDVNQSFKNDIIGGIDISGLDNYYKEEFTKIYQSNGEYEGKWNWFAFFFTWVWCLTKGIWAHPIIFVVIWFICIYNIPIGSPVIIIFGLSYSVFIGRRGTWLYYNVKINNNQFIV